MLFSIVLQNCKHQVTFVPSEGFSRLRLIGQEYVRVFIGSSILFMSSTSVLDLSESLNKHSVICRLSISLRWLPFEVNHLAPPKRAILPNFNETI